MAVDVLVRTPAQTCAGSLVIVHEDVEDVYVFEEDEDLRDIRDQINDLLGEVSERGQLVLKVVNAAARYVESFDAVNNVKFAEQSLRFYELKQAVGAYEQVTS